MLSVAIARHGFNTGRPTALLFSLVHDLSFGICGKNRGVVRVRSIFCRHLMQSLSEVVSLHTAVVAPLWRLARTARRLMHHQAVFTDATIAQVKTIGRHILPVHKIYRGRALIQPSGGLLSAEVEVRAGARSPRNLSRSRCAPSATTAPTAIPGSGRGPPRSAADRRLDAETQSCFPFAGARSGLVSWI